MFRWGEGKRLATACLKMVRNEHNTPVIIKYHQPGPFGRLCPARHSRGGIPKVFLKAREKCSWLG